MKKLDSKGPIILDFTRKTDGYVVYEGLQYGRKVTIHFLDRTPPHRRPATAIQCIVSIIAYDERKDDVDSNKQEVEEKRIYNESLALLEEIAGNTKMTEQAVKSLEVDETKESKIIELLTTIVENTTPRKRAERKQNPKR